MRVAVLGSWRQEDASDWALRGNAEAFGQACRRIGRELVGRGHSLILGSASRHTADGHALDGAREAWQALPAAERDRPRVLMIRPADDSAAARGKQEALLQSMPGGIVEYPVDAASWAAVKLVQTQFADALILLGGAEKTEQAGMAATLCGKPLACIGSFGGAAHRLNRRLAGSLWSPAEAPGTARLRLQGPFDEQLLTLALEQAGIEGAPKLMIIHGRSEDRHPLKAYLAQHVKKVVVLADEFAPTEPIPVKFERAAASVDGAIALVTPDDLGKFAGDTTALQPRARENVWLEVGWFWGRRGRSKVLLLVKGEVGFLSDLGNVEHHAYTHSPEEAAPAIQRFLARLRSASDA